MSTDLTRGPVMKSMLKFAVPMILGDLLQQCYNVADTLIVGKFLGSRALAAVGSSFTLMTFLTSILLGLCMGSGTCFSIRFGERDGRGLKEGICASFLLICALTALLNVLAFWSLDYIRAFLKVPGEVWPAMREYLAVIFCGIFATFLYNYFASLLRSVGNSVAPLVFLAVSAVLNIALDLWFVVGLELGVAGAAGATVIAQYVSGVGIALYVLLFMPDLRPKREELRVSWRCVKEIANFSVLTCVQQSVMNLGILLVQGVVNSFGTAVMAAFAAGVKIDAFAHIATLFPYTTLFRSIHAGTGFRKCLFHVYRAELRGEGGWAHPGGTKGRVPCGGSFRCGGLGACGGVCTPADAPVRGRRRDGDHRGRRPLSAY